MAETAPAKTKKIVVYTGTSHFRAIDAASWKQVGVEGQKKTEWSYLKGHELPVDDFNADALRYITERSGGEFEVREVPA
jgi:hypothetical protein